jgi:hypothetical protein
VEKGHGKPALHPIGREEGEKTPAISVSDVCIWTKAFGNLCLREVTSESLHYLASERFGEKCFLVLVFLLMFLRAASM